ncbi:MAG: DUF2029 domain-containing protein [Phycisphaerales bacterium]|nr:DUF2029 domain-containing protein [Phycisphaerales bacterium]
MGKDAMEADVGQAGTADPLADQGPRGRKRAVLALLAWLGVAALWAWFLHRMWRGAVQTETGDFNDFFYAAEALRHGGDPYASGRGGYLYPPLMAWVLESISWLGLVRAGVAWGIVNFLLTLACLALSVRATARALRGPCDALTVGVVWLAAMALTIGPIQAEFEHGQTDAVVLLGLCLGVVLIDRAPALAGFALGLSLLVKHHVVVVLAYLLVRRRWMASAGMLVGGLVFAFVPAVQLGVAKTGAFLAQSYGYLLNLFGGEGAPKGVNLHPITWELSISVTSAFARFFDRPGGPPMTLVGAATLPVAAAVFLATWWIYKRQGVPMLMDRGPRADRDRAAVVLLEWCGVIVGLLAFSPQSITRHTFILIPVHVLAAYILVVKRRGVVRWPLLVGVVGYQLAARLPPGEEAFRRALEAWRYVSGATWFLLAMWLGLVWSTLSFASRGGAVTRSSAPAKPGA